ncbi:MAG TPA: hypothetical protein VFW22_13615 [Pseudolabrys sp.]|nr:hypothetical protein [Pseudolabrys sp.]
MTKYLALTVAAILAGALPAVAQTAFRPGQKIMISDGDRAFACTTQGDLKNYKSAGMQCALGGGCSAVKDLETRNVCGPRSKTYIVISTDQKSDLIQISPANDKSKTYWADPNEFKPAT